MVAQTATEIPVRQILTEISVVGITAFIQKPYRLDDLRAVLKKAIG